MELNLSQKTILGFISLLKNKSAWSESESPQIQQQKNITEYSKKSSHSWLANHNAWTD